MGNSHLNTLLTDMNIPEFYIKSFKAYEKEVGVIAEKQSRQSCLNATKLERQLVIKNFSELKKLL